MNATAISRAKDTLLRALDQIEQAEQDLDAEPERVDLIVVYSIGSDDAEAWNEVSGWASTAGPEWLFAALMRRAAAAFDHDDESDEA